MTRPLILPFLLAVPLAAELPTGSWSLASAPDVPAAIDRAITPMNFLLRPFARARLKKTNLVYQHLQVNLAPGEAVIQFADRPPLHLPADGSPILLAWDHGETLTITAHLNGDDLEQTFQAKDGERTNVFHVDPDSHLLEFKVTVRSAQLPAPVTYTIDYQRTPQ